MADENRLMEGFRPRYAQPANQGYNMDAGMQYPQISQEDAFRLAMMLAGGAFGGAIGGGIGSGYLGAGGVASGTVGAGAGALYGSLMGRRGANSAESRMNTVRDAEGQDEGFYGNALQRR